MNDKIALILIDQQIGIDHPKLGQRNNPSAEQTMLSLLGTWRSNAWPIVHIKHRSHEQNSVFWPEQKGFDFKPEFTPSPEERVIEKSVPCAFTNNNLEKVLRADGIDTIVVVGAATNNSVEATARTGGNLNFTVFVVEDACFTFDKTDFFGQKRSASEVHAMSLASLHDEYATVVNSGELFNYL